jgi:Uma2 family endonuclease
MNVQTLEQKKSAVNHNHLVLYGVNWKQFESLENVFNSIGGVRFVYLDGVLEIVILGKEHEDTKGTISALLEAYMRHKNIRFYMRGSATLGKKELGARKEPDESYNIGNKKDLPDLVIEVIVTSGGVEILEIYKRVGIPEVWLWQDGLLKIYHLQENYQKVEKSLLLPDLNLKLLTKYITYYDQYDAVTEFLKELSIK